MVPVLLWTLAGIVPDIGIYNCARTAPFHPHIHVFGNVGRLGQIHATFADTATRIIDCVAYDGRNMRRELAQHMRFAAPKASSVVEMGCGVGTLSTELGETFSSVLAVDTSREMIAAAKQSPVVRYQVQNAVDVDEPVDVAVACMLFHELPANAQTDVLRAMERCTRKSNGQLWVVDLDTDYVPSNTMLAGEPYVPAYLEGIDATMHTFAKQQSLRLETFQLVPGHVRAWILSQKRFRPFWT